jgi:hypothetical protein
MAVREFRWQLSERQWAYLGWLVKHTGLGRTEKDVAQYLLNQKIQEMRLANYAEPQPEGAEIQPVSDDDATGTPAE